MTSKVFLLFLLASCAPEPGGAVESEAGARRPVDSAIDARPIQIYATAYPVAWLAERVVLGLGEVTCPVPEGVDPIHWEPPREVLEAYRNADLIVANGAGFARWLSNASLPRSRMVSSADAFRDEFLSYDTRTHSHGQAGSHTHEGIDPHTWLDPLNALRQARSIAAALTLRFARHSVAFGENLSRLEAELEDLHRAWAELSPLLSAVHLLASHPAYDYLAARQGWSLVNLDLDPGVALDETARAALRGALSSELPNLLLWESEPLPRTRAALWSELGIASVVLPPLEVLGSAERARGADYLSLQREAVERLRTAALAAVRPVPR